MEPEVKSGIFTTEFWTSTVGSIVLSILGILAVVFRIGPDEQQTLSTAVMSGLTAIGSIMGVVLLVWNYIKSRTTVKTETLRAFGQFQIARSMEMQQRNLGPAGK